MSASQLQRDAALSSFSSEATNPSSIASFTFVGLVGKFARVGILSSLDRHTSLPLQNFLSHLGSVAAEAGTITLLQNGWNAQDFFKHFVNFAVFRLTARTGAACCAPTQHFIQSAAMMAGHQAAAFLNLEEVSSRSLSQQFFDANLATLQIALGTNLASRILAGRLQQIEKNLESPAKAQNLLHNIPEQELARFSTHDRQSLSAEENLRIQSLASKAFGKGDLNSLDELFNISANPRGKPGAVALARTLLETEQPIGITEKARTNLDVMFRLTQLIHIGNPHALAALAQLDAFNYVQAFKRARPEALFFACMAGVYGLRNLPEAMRESAVLGEHLFASEHYRSLPDSDEVRSFVLARAVDLHGHQSGNQAVLLMSDICFGRNPIDPTGQLLFHAQHNFQVFHLVVDTYRAFQNPDFTRWILRLNVNILAEQTPAREIFAEDLAYLAVEQASTEALEVLAARAPHERAAFEAIGKIHLSGQIDCREYLREMDMRYLVDSETPYQKPELFEIVCLCADAGNPQAIHYIDKIHNLEIQVIYEVHQRRFKSQRALFTLHALLQNDPRITGINIPENEYYQFLMAAWEEWQTLKAEERRSYLDQERTEGEAQTADLEVPPAIFFLEIFHSALPDNVGLRDSLWIHQPFFDHFDIPKSAQTRLIAMIASQSLQNPNLNLNDVLTLVKNEKDTEHSGEFFIGDHPDSGDSN